MLYSKTICGEIKNPSHGIQFVNAGTRDVLLGFQFTTKPTGQNFDEQEEFHVSNSTRPPKNDGIDIQLHSSVYLKKSYSSSFVCYIIFCMPYFDCSVTYYQ